MKVPVSSLIVGSIFSKRIMDRPWPLLSGVKKKYSGSGSGSGWYVAHPILVFTRRRIHAWKLAHEVSLIDTRTDTQTGMSLGPGLRTMSYSFFKCPIEISPNRTIVLLILHGEDICPIVFLLVKDNAEMFSYSFFVDNFKTTFFSLGNCYGFVLILSLSGGLNFSFAFRCLSWKHFSDFFLFVVCVKFVFHITWSYCFLCFRTIVLFNCRPPGHVSYRCWTPVTSLHRWQISGLC